MTSGNSRMTCGNDRMMPISRTPMIRPLSQGLALKALMICRCSTKAINPHRMRNTSIRTRKMRGEESLAGSSYSPSAVGLASVISPIWHSRCGRKTHDCLMQTCDKVCGAFDGMMPKRCPDRRSKGGNRFSQKLTRRFDDARGQRLIRGGRMALLDASLAASLAASFAGLLEQAEAARGAWSRCRRRPGPWPGWRRRRRGR